MSEQKAAVEVKQEGEFTLKGKNLPKRKAKDLGKTKNEPVKMEMKKPVEEKVETPKIDLTKKEDNAVQERKTEEIPVGDKPEASKKVDGEVRVSNTDEVQKSESPLVEITEEPKPEVKKLEKEIKEAKRDEQVLGRQLPENIDLNSKGNPLDNAKKWKEVKINGKTLTRETDTLDTFVDSSWYFIRFCSPKNDKYVMQWFIVVLNPKSFYEWFLVVLEFKTKLSFKQRFRKQN